MRKDALEAKERDRRVHMIRREILEAKLSNDMQLIYPILSH